MSTGCVPRFGSSQTGGSQTDQTGRGPRPKKRGKKARPVLKVMLPSSTFPKTGAESVGRIETTESKTRRAEKQNSQSPDGSVYVFSEIPSDDATIEDKARLSVLRTISKMLEENQLIRQRLAAKPAE